MTALEFFAPIGTIFLGTLQVVFSIFAICAAIGLAFWVIVVFLHAGRMIRDGEWGGWRK